MINLDSFVEFISSDVNKALRLLDDFRKLSEISDATSDILGRLGSSIDSYNSSYVSLSTFDNDGTETTSATRKAAAYSPVRAKISIALNKLISDLKMISSSACDIHIPSQMSILTDDAVFSGEYLPLIIPKDGYFSVKQRRLTLNPGSEYPDTSEPTFGITPIQLKSNDGNKLTRYTNLSNAGIINSENVLSYDRCAVTTHGSLKERVIQTNAYNTFIFQTTILYSRTGVIIMVFEINNTPYWTSTTIGALSAVYHVGDILLDRTSMLVDFANKFITGMYNSAISGSISSSIAIDGVSYPIGVSSHDVRRTIDNVEYHFTGSNEIQFFSNIGGYQTMFTRALGPNTGKVALTELGCFSQLRQTVSIMNRILSNPFES